MIPDHYTDEAIAARAVAFESGQRDGTSRAAHYLKAIPAHARQAVVSAATLRGNMSGGRYADNVEVCCQNWAYWLKPETIEANNRLARGTYSEPNLQGSGGHGI